MIPRNTSKTIRTHKNIRTLRSLPTRVGAARGEWSRLRESEDLRRRLHPVRVVRAPNHQASQHQASHHQASHHQASHH